MTDAATPLDSSPPAQPEPLRSGQTLFARVIKFGMFAGALSLMFYVAYDFSPDLRAGVVRVMGRTGSAGIRWVVLGLWDKDQIVQSAAEETLNGKGTAAVSEVRQLLKSADPHIRNGACNALRLLGKTARVALPDLIAAVEHDQDSAVRSQAVSSLVSLGGDDPDVRKTLMKVVADKKMETNARLNAMQPLANRLPENRSVVPLLLEALEDADMEIRAAAAEFLGDATLDKETVVPALRHALRDGDPYVREEIEEALEKLGESQTQPAP